MTDLRSAGHVKIDHKFNFSQFDYDHPIDFQRTFSPTLYTLHSILANAVIMKHASR